jgi:hypothetical protein
MNAPTTAAVDTLDHLGLLYGDEREYLDGTVSVIEAGLVEGAPVLVAVPEPNLSALRSAVPTADGITFVDMTHAGRNPDRILPAVLLAFADEHPGVRVRIVSEPLYPGRDPLEVPACVRHEALINAAFAGREATILCPYDATRLTPGELHYAERTHPVMRQREGDRPGRGYADPELIVALLNQPLLPPRQVERSLVVDAYHLDPVRVLLREYAGCLGPGRLAGLEQAVAELVSIMPARAGGATVRLRLWRAGDRVVCELHGPGEAVDPPTDQAARARSLAAANARCDLVQTYLSGTATIVRVHALSGT